MICRMPQRVSTRTAIARLNAGDVCLHFPLQDGVVHDFHSFSLESCQLVRHAIRSMGQQGYAALSTIPERFWGRHLNGFHLASVITAFRSAGTDINDVPDVLVTKLAITLSFSVTLLREWCRRKRIDVVKIKVPPFNLLSAEMAAAIRGMQQDAARPMAKPPLVDEYLTTVIAAYRGELPVVDTVQPAAQMLRSGLNLHSAPPHVSYGFVVVPGISLV